jgi:polysaccharide export outer membrane protein
VLLAAALTAASCAERLTAPDPAPCSGAACDSEDYRIGPGDVLQISVWKDDSLNRSVPVRPDGMISFPLLNDVPAAGLTPLQLRESLTAKLKQYLAAPEVSVVVQEVHSYAVTVLDAIAAAGGLDEFASPSHIVVLRHAGDAQARFGFDYARAVAGDGRQKNFYVHAGDIVMVP